MAKNVLGGELQACSMDPMTGYFRDGCCHTRKGDTGMHTICAVMTEDFLIYSKSMGNDLMTPRLEFQFPGLKAGDRWCVCLGRWVEALRDALSGACDLRAGASGPPGRGARARPLREPSEAGPSSAESAGAGSAVPLGAIVSPARQL